MMKYQAIREKTEACRWEITPNYTEKLEEAKIMPSSVKLIWQALLEKGYTWIPY